MHAPTLPATFPLLLNGVGWNIGLPRLFATSQLAFAKRLAVAATSSLRLGTQSDNDLSTRTKDIVISALETTG